jgi:hypothetical protein
MDTKEASKIISSLTVTAFTVLDLSRQCFAIAKSCLNSVILNLVATGANIDRVQSETDIQTGSRVSDRDSESALLSGSNVDILEERE